jgi:hypothetical protein
MLPDNCAMNLLPLGAPPLLAGSATTLRPVARRIATACRQPAADLVERAAAVTLANQAVGRVHSAGAWSDSGVHAALSNALDRIPAWVLKQTFEWYLCRGAHFHTDAHYADVLFGVWYVVGPPVDIVFARGPLSVPARPGSIVVFDPFEVHGVLRPGASEYRAEDYAAADTSVFVGFEVEIDAAVRAEFDLTAEAGARLMSSGTRIAATTGAFE